MEISQGVVTVVLSTAVTVLVTLVRRERNRTNTVAAAVLMFVAFALSLAAGEEVKRGASAIAYGLAILAILCGVAAAITWFWGFLVPSPSSSASAGAARSWRDWPPTTWPSRVLFALLTALLGSTALIFDGTAQRVEVGTGIFVGVLLLTYVGDVVRRT